jgi:hypothetical protein
MLFQMLCPHCKFQQSNETTECPRCGIIFAKYHPTSDSHAQHGVVRKANSDTFTALSYMFPQWVKDVLLPVDPLINPVVYGGRLLIYAGLVLWGLKFLSTPMETNYVGESFMHMINLPFHEAGHLIFSPVGRFMQVLGGSLGQLLMPLICLGALLIQNRDAFGATVGLWWFAESLMDLAPYINDARALDLVLLGGVTGKEVEDYHDWEHILRTLGWLQYDHVLAHSAHVLGSLLMILAFIWGGYMLLLQFKSLQSFSIGRHVGSK